MTPGLILQAREQASSHALPPANPETSHAPRVGFTASKKVGNSVARNRARRRLKAAVQNLFEDHARSGMDYVLIGRHSTLDRPWSRLLQDLRQAMIKLDVWCDEDATRLPGKSA